MANTAAGPAVLVRKATSLNDDEVTVTHRHIKNLGSVRHNDKRIEAEELVAAGRRLCRENNLASAEGSYRRAIDIQTDVLGQANPDVHETMLELASVLDRQGKGAEANEIAEHLTQIRSRTDTVSRAGGKATSREASSTTTSDWIDVLKTFDPAHHVVKGTWQRHEGEGVVSKTTLPELFDGGAARVILPVALRRGYEVEVSFMKNSRSAKVALILPVGGRQVLLNFGARYKTGVFHGLGLVNSEGPDRNGTGVEREPLEVGRQYKVHVKVSLDGHRASIVAALDGEEIIHWKGLQVALRAHWHYGLPDPRCLGLVAFSPTTFQRVRLRPLDGNAEVMPNMHVERLGFAAAKMQK